MFLHLIESFYKFVNLIYFEQIGVRLKKHLNGGKCPSLQVSGMGPDLKKYFQLRLMFSKLSALSLDYDFHVTIFSQSKGPAKGQSMLKIFFTIGPFIA